MSGEYVLSAVGVGQDFDETLMSALADAGTGNFYYLPDARELAGIFAGEFASARETVARGLRVRARARSPASSWSTPAATRWSATATARRLPARATSTRVRSGASG